MLEFLSQCHPTEMNAHGHHGKTERHNNRKRITRSFQQCHIAAIVHAQRSERALKPMQQVIRQRNTTKHIDHHHEQAVVFISKHFYHLPVKIVVLFSVIAYRAQFMNGTHAAKTTGCPEMIEVHDQEQQDQRAEDTHTAAIPLAAPVAIVHRVTNLPVFPVFQSQCIRLYNMDNENDEKPDFHDPYDDHCAHEMSGFVEGFATVRNPDTGIDAYVNHQERDEK
jgi:hypothetical protein